MKLNYKEKLRRYLIDLDEKFFCEYDDIEIVNSWINREKLEKFIPKMNFIQKIQLQNSDKKVFEYMKKYKNKPVYPILENIAEIIKNSALYKKVLKKEVEVV
jgi:hypothetical protein